jgi:demethylmenaquinone methyltransferase/2-methoxy-6-polyprenyl-1,4-benzoquinol methylase
MVRTIDARRLFAGLPRSYERMGAVLSFGQDPRWRRFLVSRLDDHADTVLDVATGTGLVARATIQAGKARSVVALDQSEPMVREARRRGGSVSFVLADAERPPLPDACVDALTVTYLFRYVDDPAATIRGLASLVRPGGVIASLEFAVPEAPWALACWRLYTRRVMPTVGRLVSPAWARVGRFLGPNIESFWVEHPLETQVRGWRDAGVSDVRWRRMSNGAGIVIWGRKG